MKRLGVLTPSSNTVLEPMMSRLLSSLADELSLHYARFRVTEIADDLKSDRQFDLDPMLQAAGQLSDAGVDAILWAGTSGAWRGLEADDRLVSEIRSTTGIPATTATNALLEAFRALEIRRYALVVPYVEAITGAIVRTLAGGGWGCVGSSSDSLTINREFAMVTPASIAARARELAKVKPDAIVIHCTNMRGAEVAESLERELSIPVLDSVVVGSWGALGILGLPVPAVGFGRLARVGRQPGVVAVAARG
jgi:maleate isomerase